MIHSSLCGYDDCLSLPLAVVQLCLMMTGGSWHHKKRKICFYWPFPLAGLKDNMFPNVMDKINHRVTQIGSGCHTKFCFLRSLVFASTRPIPRNFTVELHCLWRFRYHILFSRLPYFLCRVTSLQTNLLQHSFSCLGWVVCIYLILSPKETSQ